MLEERPYQEDAGRGDLKKIESVYICERVREREIVRENSAGREVVDKGSERRSVESSDSP